MCGAIVTAPLDVVKTRLQSNLFQKQAAADGAVLHRHGVRGLLWNFVDTGKIIRSVWHLPRSPAELRSVRWHSSGPFWRGVPGLTKIIQPTAMSTCTKALAHSSKVSVRHWQAQFPHGSLSLDHFRSHQLKLILILCLQINKLFRVRERQAPVCRVVQRWQGEFGDPPHGRRNSRQVSSRVLGPYTADDPRISCVVCSLRCRDEPG